MQRRWIVPPPCDPLAAGRILRELNVPSFLAELLVRRGHHALESAGRFLQPKLKSLRPPEEIPGIPQAAKRVGDAISSHERIALFGDYDVDGISSLAILYRILRAYGADVHCFLPMRREEGYGLSAAGVERCCETIKPTLLVAVDCGTTSVREIATLRSRGIDVVVLDHHEPDSTLPDCHALVNPKCGNDFHYLCSAGIAFKLAHAMLKIQPVAGVVLREYLDLVALATVADIVPLVGENRILVRHGLQQMATSRWPGIQSLLRISGITPPVRSSDVGFRIGPRINASGRLASALESLNILITDDPIEADRIAARLDTFNRERQNVERAVITDAEQWLERHFDPSTSTSIVAGSRDWHVGVIGVVAARVMRKHYRPTFIVGFDPSGTGKGSGRSIEGLSLVSLLRQCAGHLEKFGGHEMAAGVTVHERSFPEFQSAFESAARAVATEEILTPRLHLDAEIEMHDLEESLLDAQDMVEPFGFANTQPVFYTRAISPAAPPRILKDKHLKIDFAIGRRRVPAVYFNARMEELPRPPWDVAFSLEWNSWQGRTEAQMRIVDVRPAA